MKYSGNYYVNFQNYQNLRLLSTKDTKRTLMHLFLFTNSAQRELVSICTESIHNCNCTQLSINIYGLQYTPMYFMYVQFTVFPVLCKLYICIIQFNLAYNVHPLIRFVKSFIAKSSIKMIYHIFEFFCLWSHL